VKRWQHKIIYRKKYLKKEWEPHPFPAWLLNTTQAGRLLSTCTRLMLYHVLCCKSNDQILSSIETHKPEFN
jgi:hypothetical protein